MPDSSQRPFSSVKATVAIVSPEAIPGRYSAFAAASSDCNSALAARATVEKNGAHSRRRPISSKITHSST